MTKIDVHVAEPFSASKQRILAALERADRGEIVNEFHIVFPSWASLAAVMTPRRFDILKHLHQQPEASTASLARTLKRDYKRVHADVEALSNAGLIDRTDGELRTGYDEIRTSIAL